MMKQHGFDCWQRLAGWVLALSLCFPLPLVLSACTKAKQANAGKPLTLKVGKSKDNSPATEPEESLDEAVLGSAKRRHLPLAGTKWQWEGQLADGQFDDLGKPLGYTLAFKPNGWFDFRADCKHGTGIYEANGQKIVFAVIKSSQSRCRNPSVSEQFQKALESAREFRQGEDKLFIDIKREGKTLVFGLR